MSYLTDETQWREFWDVLGAGGEPESITWRDHRLGTVQADDALVHHEADERFWTGLGRTRSERFLLVASGSKTTSEYRFLDTEDEAVALANNTEFGLGGIVFGADEQRALEVARRVDSGSVGINFFGSNHSAPFGGRHDSGLGVEYGIEGLSAYLTYKSIHRRTR